MRQYCKAYHLGDLRAFEGWSESQVDWKDEPNADDQAEKPAELVDGDIVFIHQDYTVTKSMWHNENVIFNDVTPEWEKFCRSALSFEIPEDLRPEPAVEKPKAKKPAKKKTAQKKK